MVSREITVRTTAGLKSKAAALFIHKSSSYKSSIWIEKDDRKANAKSLLGLLSLGIGDGTIVILVAEGADEEVAIDELEAYLNSNLGDND